MKPLLSLAEFIDAVNNRFGTLANWAVLFSCFISCANAVLRFGFSLSSNAWLEIQWYLFAGAVMLGASMVLRVNEHVRVDVIYGQLSARIKVMVDLFGLTCFLLPVMGLMIYLSFPLFLQMFNSGEVSSNAGGLIRWPVYAMIPLGFTLLMLQGWSELIKRIAFLQGLIEDPTVMKVEKTAEEELAEAIRRLAETKTNAS